MKKMASRIKNIVKENQVFFLNAPMLIYLFLVLVAPMLWGIGLSFTNKTIGGPASFNGLSNFKSLLTDPEYLNSILNTIKYTFFSLIGKVIFGTIMALALNRKFKGRNLVRALLMIPWALPNIVVVLNWKLIFSSAGGVANHILNLLGIVNGEVVWFGSAGLAMIIIVLANIWRGTPFFGISILAKLQTIPQEYYEAAEMDGASKIHQFIHITLPEIKDVILLSTLMSSIWTMNEFETVWLLTGGGPSGTTQVMNVFSYVTAMTRMQLGKGMAVSVIALPIFILIIAKLSKKMLGENK